jgi:uncharacterized protein YndB with AHSA1/START domain
MSDEATVTVSTTVEAAAERVYDLVSDITRMGEWSPEALDGEWRKGVDGPVVGARFKGKNQKGWRRWSTTCEVTEADPGKVFTFRVTSIGGMRVATWRYAMEPAGAGTKVTEEWTDDRGGTMKVLGRLATGVADRADHNRGNMEATLAALKAAAEAR